MSSLPETERSQITENIGAVQGFYAREELKISHSQRALEKLSWLIGQPAYLGATLVGVLVWTIGNVVMQQLGLYAFDPPPFLWLQGLVGLGALVTTTVVLIKQNRLAGLAEQRAHLDLKVTLLTEQKVAKLIDLIEELRRDLPNVENRDDPEAVALQHSMNPELVLAALDENLNPPLGAGLAPVPPPSE